MTRLEALRGLYDAVKEGHMPTFPVSFAAIGEAAHLADKALDRGSVDAALALIAATLPDRFWDLWRTTTFGDDSRKFGCNLTGVDTEYAANPATALLLACIAALIATEESK
jgi:hypothetical protein